MSGQLEGKDDENPYKIPKPKKALAASKPLSKYFITTSKDSGVRFFKEANRRSIMMLETEEPFRDAKLFELHGMDLHPVKVENLQYYPYSGCIFDVLKEPDNELRFTKLKKFFKFLGMPGDISESTGLLYTIMQFWKFFCSATMAKPSPKNLATFKFIMDAGIFQSIMRILERCLDCNFFLKEYNRLIPYRALELLFAAAQIVNDVRREVVEILLAEPEKAFDIFYPMICGKISAVEQIITSHVTANFSWCKKGLTWLMDHPQIIGRIGWHMWGTYSLLFKSIIQYEELQVLYMKHQIFSHLIVLNGDISYDSMPLAVADVSTFLVLCCLCNVCGTHLEGKSKEQIEPSLLAIVNEGLYNHIGTVSYTIILNNNKYQDLCINKYLSFLSWNCFQLPSQRAIIEQFHSLPTHRNDSPLFFDKDSFSKSRSMIAFIVTHAIHLDYDKGSQIVTLAIMYLLRGDEDGAMDLIRWSGDILFDLSHSVYFTRLPSKRGKALTLRRVVLETMLKFGGSSFIEASGSVVEPSEKRFAEPMPGCIEEARGFCRRYLKETTLSKSEKLRLVSCADSFKEEGNTLFTKKKYYSAMECYTRALDLCPLSCIKKRVTYYSNRAECYLKTGQSFRALRDCNKALAQNPRNLKTRWRRSQAFQNMRKKYAAALDLFTIKQHPLEAQEIFGRRLYNDLDPMIHNLLDEAEFHHTAIAMSGPAVISGGMKRKDKLNEDHFDIRHCLPPFTGQYYHEVLSLKRGDPPK